MVLLWPADMRQEYRTCRIPVDPIIWEPVFNHGASWVPNEWGNNLTPAEKKTRLGSRSNGLELLYGQGRGLWLSRLITRRTHAVSMSQTTMRQPHGRTPSGCFLLAKNCPRECCSKEAEKLKKMPTIKPENVGLSFNKNLWAICTARPSPHFAIKTLQPLVLGDKSLVNLCWNAIIYEVFALS